MPASSGRQPSSIHNNLPTFRTCVGSARLGPQNLCRPPLLPTRGSNPDGQMLGDGRNADHGEGRFHVGTTGPGTPGPTKQGVPGQFQSSNVGCHFQVRISIMSKRPSNSVRYTPPGHRDAEITVTRTESGLRFERTDVEAPTHQTCMEIHINHRDSVLNSKDTGLRPQWFSILENGKPLSYADTLERAVTRVEFELNAGRWQKPKHPANANLHLYDQFLQQDFDAIAQDLNDQLDRWLANLSSATSKPQQPGCHSPTA